MSDLERKTSQQAAVNMGDEFAASNGHRWKVVGFTTIVSGVVDAHLSDGFNVISYLVDTLDQHFTRVPQQQASINSGEKS